MIEFLQGKKTYILGCVGLVVIGLYYFGYIPAEVANPILAAVGFGGLITLKAGQSRGF